MTDDFHLPIAFDLAATGLFALSGAIVAVRKGYDVAGLVVLSLVAGIGGGLLRDGIFLQDGPPAAIRDHRYVLAVACACAVGWFFGASLDQRFRWLFTEVDALGLAAYAVVGAQMTLAAGLLVPAALVVGVINAVGGGLLRDVLSRDEVELFKPGGYYALAAFAGALTYCGLAKGLGVDGVLSALAGMAVTFALRVLSVRLRWNTWSAPGRLPRRGRRKDGGPRT